MRHRGLHGPVITANDIVGRAEQQLYVIGVVDVPNDATA